MKKSIVVLAILLSACAGVGTIKDKPQLYAGKFKGNHPSLARCVVDRMQADSRWVIRELQYKMWLYPDIEASEIYAYALSAIPDMYARNSPLNPDAVVSYAKPAPEIRAYTDSAYTGPVYAFVLLIKKTDDATVVATLKGDKYEGRIAWESLQACAAL